MQRMLHTGIVVVVLIALTTAASHSQTQRPRVRATRRSAPQPVQPQFGGGSLMGPIDPNSTPAELQAQHQRDFQQRMTQMQQHFAEMQRMAEESRSNAIRQALGAGDEQWNRVKPRLDAIDRLKAEADAAIEPGSFGSSGTMQGGMTSFSGGFGGGWAGGFSAGGSGPQQSQFHTWGSPSSRGTAEMTDGQALCEQLQRALQNPGTPPAEIATRVAALRQARTRAREQLAQARQQLRGLLTSPQQEAALVVMGYLD